MTSLDRRAVAISPLSFARRPALTTLRPDGLSLLAFLAGACIAVHVDVVGEAFLVELLLPLVVLFGLLSRGMGPRFQARSLVLLLGAGALTLTGYLISDLAAATDQWQYLRGWGRVLLLITDCVAMLLLVSQGARNLWWFVLGLGLGGIGWLLATGVAFSTWKIGYGEYTAFLVAALSGLFPRFLGASALAACGVVSLLLDYRSLGATCVLGAALVYYAGRRAGRRALGLRRLAVVGGLIVAALGAMALLLDSTDDQFENRRKASNGGRYIGVMVALNAIAESPVVGYGSWAAEGKFAQLLRTEQLRLERELGHRVEVGRSLLPHSQLLQAWVEGGFLGTTFFLLYGAMLFWALRWFLFFRHADGLSGVAIFSLLYGLWNFFASPFLGFTRIYIAIAVGTIVIARWEATRAKGRQPPASLARG